MSVLLSVVQGKTCSAICRGPTEPQDVGTYTSASCRLREMERAGTTVPLVWQWPREAMGAVNLLHKPGAGPDWLVNGQSGHRALSSIMCPDKDH
jgi:hypothetical protein